MTRRPEEALHRQVAQYLALIEKQAGFFWLHCPNGGARTKAEAGILRALGVKAGTPDILLIHQGKAHWLELKAPPKMLPGGKISQAKPAVSEAQEATMLRLQLAGCEVAIVRSLNEVQLLLKRWGIVPD